MFQPVIMATMSITAVTYAINGAFTLETIKLFFIGLPVLAGGLWIGIKLYGRGLMMRPSEKSSYGCSFCRA